eukprot:GHVQ01024097.1.p2 GENE.GHVQ01024097.1~~GHVQ01024097.1.p2  ORF type:complete len:353 (+),score=36.85 GHVQ01024097.1:301-1359(+)
MNAGKSNSSSSKSRSSKERCLCCGIYGHLAEDCRDIRSRTAHFKQATDTEQPQQTNVVRCYHCGKTGHFTQECRMPTRCDKCGSLGHKFSQCTVRICSRCGKHGHEERMCTKSNALTCKKCGKQGHLGRACPTYTCRWCGEVGHRPMACPKNPRQESSRQGRLDQRQKDTAAFHMEKTHAMLKGTTDTSQKRIRQDSEDNIFTPGDVKIKRLEKVLTKKSEQPPSTGVKHNNGREVEHKARASQSTSDSSISDTAALLPLPNSAALLPLPKSSLAPLLPTPSMPMLSKRVRTTCRVPTLITNVSTSNITNDKTAGTDATTSKSSSAGIMGSPAPQQRKARHKSSVRKLPPPF